MKRNSHCWWRIGFPVLTFFFVSVARAGEPAIGAATSLAELRQQLEAHVNQPRFAGALWGVKAAIVGSGQTVFEHQPIRLMSPASNSKLYTGALALDRFGGEFRIVTPILASAKPDAAGRIAGDLIVSGRGDPSWKAKPRGGDFWRTFDPFVAVLKQAGVRHITGSVVGDATFFHSPPYGAGWVAEDLTDDYGAEVSALTLEENFIDVRVTAAATAGQPCTIEVLYPLSGLVVHNRTVTAPEGTARSLHSWRAPGGNTVYLFGEMPLGGAEYLLDLTVPQPERWFAATLREALIRAGITVDGEARGVRWPEASPVPAGAVKMGEVMSPPLREMVAAFMKPSQNLETDLIFAQVGEAVRPADAPIWRTTEPFAVGGLREFLDRSGLPADEVKFDEGSGLSRNNLASANATVALLRFMAAHREANAFADSLPIAGVDGTLRRRMKTTAAEGNVRAKTGTLRWASSLSGYVTTAAGERLAFSVMLNRSVTPTGRFARDDVDAIAVMLAGFQGRIEASGVNSEARKP